MLIPSIDLMEGKVVQLIQGSRKALEFDDLQHWIDRFSKYPLVQVIDLDAAMGRGNNQNLVREIARQLPCQVGGGLRSIDSARATLDLVRGVGGQVHGLAFLIELVALNGRAKLAGEQVSAVLQY